MLKIGSPTATTTIKTTPPMRATVTFSPLPDHVVDAAVNQTAAFVIPIPAKYAIRFPDPAAHNHGFAPHITLAVVDQVSPPPGFQTALLHHGRSVGRRVRPFRVFVDPNGGLYDFGAGSDGEKALWLPARSDPPEALHNLHRFIRFYLEREKIPVLSYASFTPHVTWRYVPNDEPETARMRHDALAANQFPNGFWFDVTSFNLSLPDGKQKPIMLNPTA